MNTCIQILHLEDDARDAELVQATLLEAEIACQITRVQSRAEFTQALQQGEYVVILADYHLPDYDGMSALRLAQERCPGTPFIFVSGVLGEEAAIEALTQGATDYVLKHNLARLGPAVTRALEEAENRKERRRAEAALRESEARYRRITEALTDYMYTVRVEGGQAVETRHGPGCLAVTGYMEEELAVDPDLWIRMVVDADRPAVQDQARRVLAGEDTPAIEHRIIRKDGAQRWVCNTPVPRRDEQGILRSYDGLIQDITARKQAEELLQASETRYRSLFEDSPVSLWEEDFMDVKNFLDTLRDAGISDVRTYFEQHPEAVQECAAMVNIVDVNRVTLDMFQCPSKAEFVTNLTQVLGPKSYDVFREELVSLAEGKQVFEAESHHQTLRGDDVYVTLKLTIIPGNEDTWSKVLVSMTDITERKRTEEELTRHREHLEELVAERTEALEQEIVERQHIEQALQHAKDAALEAQHAAEAANRAKSVFLANMSHELRTPLNAILGFAQLLQRDPDLTPAWQEKVATILRSGEHLLRLINDVLDLSKIEAGRLTLQIATVDLWDLLTMLEDMLRERATRKGLHLTVIRATDVPRYIQADEVKFRQVLVNLVSNAIKFTEQGEVSLRVSELYELNELKDSATQKLKNSKTQKLLFEISDTGIGIAPDDLETIFGTFTQGQQVQQIVEGSGLGLAISRTFVRLMGGEIRVTSEVGKGSCFSVVLPMESVEMAPVSTRHLSRQIIGLAPNQPEYRLLVVDDQAEQRSFLTQLLQSVGFVVREAGNGQEALTQIASWQAHLVFMDMRMPVMDGYEATKRIRALGAGSSVPGSGPLESGKDFPTPSTQPPAPSPQHPVIIALTSHAFKEDQADILACGCDDVLSKPVKEEKIFDTVRHYLGVQYVYDEPVYEAKQPSHPAVKNILTPDILAALPIEMINRLKTAIIRGDIELIAQEIAMIRERDGGVADALAELTRRFEYDTILTMLQRIHEEYHE